MSGEAPPGLRPVHTEWREVGPSYAVATVLLSNGAKVLGLVRSRGDVAAKMSAVVAQRIATGDPGRRWG